MDGPIQNGPMMRWQRKAQESGASATSPSKSRCKTPGKSGTVPGGATSKTPKTPSCKSPARSSLDDKAANGSRSGKKTKTPGAKTPGMHQDRFIPSRATSDMEYGHFAVTKKMDDEEENMPADENVNSQEYRHQLMEAMEMKDRKILNFKGKAPEASRPAMNSLNVLYSCNKSTSKQSATSRHIPRAPDRVLDAPQLLDDYYLNLLDWSQNNILSVVLGTAVFLWNADTGNITQLMELTNTQDYVSSVSSVPESTALAVGLSNGNVQLWDTEQQKLLRTMSGHPARVGSLSWNTHILSSGSRTGAIHHHDVRVAQHQVAELIHHNQEVCGLSWAPDGRHLASGGNDNLVNVWGNQIGPQQPLYTFSDHQAAVKAIAWCPWKPHLLATGGGTADRHIRMWNVQSGTNLGAYDSESQVCSILWSKEYKELISGHGYALNHIRIWKYPTMTKVVDLVGHSARVLSMAMSPDGTTVASAAADETIRLWKCFATNPQTKKPSQSASESTKSKGYNMCIR
ncbi:cell division cycle protein 20 homolog [Plakobranchus ocellatus]|uniref:Cell division cycle protein 20 homolog n=1 Tax=Plakobranchus ocellatus TaxID=259542 RepID=A0AAV4DX70_9GAST|nr:cell division cycle protein 20 homolog [Plakobranchus ocellatus]